MLAQRARRCRIGTWGRAEYRYQSATAARSSGAGGIRRGVARRAATVVLTKPSMWPGGQLNSTGGVTDPRYQCPADRV